LTKQKAIEAWRVLAITEWATEEEGQLIKAKRRSLVMAEVMSLLEAEPDSKSQPGPDIPALREELTILVSTGKAKEAIGMQLTQEQVKCLEDKDVEKYYKRYETYVGAKTTQTFVDSCLLLYTRAVGMFVPIKEVEALQNNLKKDYVITKELSTLVRSLALRCGRLLKVANTVLITTKHRDFEQSSATAAEQSKATAAEQSLATAEQLVSIAN